MASFKSTYLANKILDAIFGNTALPAFANVYLALMTAAPTAAGGGTEAAYTSYARAAVAGNPANWPVAVAGVKTIGAAISFPVGTGTTSGLVIGVGVYDALVAGNLLYYTDLAVPYQKTYGVNDQPIIPLGALTVTEI